jgi:hypothetical protein
MVEQAHQALGAILTRWTTGGAAAPAAPEAWRGAIADSGAGAELALLALSGHLLGAMATAEPPAELATLPDLPPLPLPTLPDGLRPLARRVVLAARDSDQRGALLELIEARGWTLHPGDWMPLAGDESVPEVYTAWRDWAALAGGGEAAPSAGERLTEESWNDFGPAGRAAALARLRRSDPGAARTLLESRIGGEPAESRLRLVQSLSDGLCEDDVPLLESLLADRAPKVKAVAASLLARLGRRGAADEDAAELAAFFSIRSKGLLRRTRALEPNPTKTPAQAHRRDELLTRVDYPSFAAALELAPDELFGLWTWDSDYRVDCGFIAMIAASAPDPIAAAALEALGRSGSGDPQRLMPLLPRLSPAQRTAAAESLLGSRGASFQSAVSFGGGRCGHPDPLRTQAGAVLLDWVGRDEGGRNAALAGELHALGLVASRQGAGRAMEMLGKAGVIGSDPRLDMLRLNAALEDRGVSG